MLIFGGRVHTGSLRAPWKSITERLSKKYFFGHKSLLVMIFQDSSLLASLTGRHLGARPGHRSRIGGGRRRAQAGAGLGRRDNDLWSVCAAA